jgi:hypothetical protein
VALTAPRSGPSVTYGVPTVLPIATGVLAVLAGVLGVLSTDRENRVVAIAVCVLLLLITGVAVTMRRRLTVDAWGLLLRGPFGGRRVAWDRVVSMSAPTRRRRGMNSISLEIELSGDELLILSRTELGRSPQDVLPVLRQWQPGR